MQEALHSFITDAFEERGATRPDSFSGGTRLREDLGLDSLELAVLTVKIEAEFGVDVFADGIVTTIGEIEEKIRRHQANDS